MVAIHQFSTQISRQLLEQLARVEYPDRMVDIYSFISFGQPLLRAILFEEVMLFMQ